MLRLRVTYADASDLRRALDQDVARGVLLVKLTPPDSLGFRDVVILEIVSPGGSVALETEVVSILPGVGVAVTFPPARVAEARALLSVTPLQEGAGAAVHEIVPDAPAPTARPPSAAGNLSTAEKIQLALHGTREDRAAILRDQNRTLHGFVLKSPQVTLEEVTAWAKNPQMSVDFLKQIGERQDWLSRPVIAQALVRNPKTPAELALRALDHVPAEALRQMAKGVGVPPHVVQAARRKVIAR